MEGSNYKEGKAFPGVLFDDLTSHYPIDARQQKSQQQLLLLHSAQGERSIVYVIAHYTLHATFFSFPSTSPCYTYYTFDDSSNSSRPMLSLPTAELVSRGHRGFFSIPRRAGLIDQSRAWDPSKATACCLAWPPQMRDRRPAIYDQSQALAHRSAWI